MFFLFFFSSRRRHTRCGRDWSSDVCSSDLPLVYDVVDPGADVERNLHTGVLTLTVVKLTFNQVLKSMIGGNNVYLVLHTHTGHLLPHFYLVTLSLKNLTNKLLKGIT